VGLGAVLGPITLMMGAFLAAYKFGEVVGKDIPILGAAGTAFGNLAFEIVNLGDNAAEAMAKQAAHTQELGDAAVAIARVQMELENLTPEQTVEVNLALGNFFDDIDAVDVRLSLMESTEIEITADASQVEGELHKVVEWNEIILGDGTVIPVSVDSTGAAASAQAAKDDIDEILPTEKQIEIKLQGDIDIELQRIKSMAETLQASFEWNAKIEIADIEANAQIIEALAETIGIAWASTADVISSALGILADVQPGSPAYRVIEDALESELKIRRELLVLQQGLTAAQIENIKARTDAIKSGAGVITISADGIEPELELVLQKIIKLAQIQANEEGFGMLLGL
jgi:hypothetical protein